MPQETKVGNDFVVDLILTAPLEQAVKSDELDDTINYAAVYAVVKEQMDIPSKLIEHAAGRILYALKERFPQLAAVELKLSKLNPPSEVMSIAHRSSLVKLLLKSIFAGLSPSAKDFYNLAGPLFGGRGVCSVSL